MLEFDSAREAVLEPHLAIKRFDLPRHVVLCFFRDAITAFVEELGGREIGKLGSEMGWFPVFEVEIDGQRVAVAQAGVGAPLAAGWLEELITLGGRAFVAAGGAGVLVPDLAMGHVIVPTAAVRDEGTSYHYLPASRDVAPTADALEAIVRTLDARGVPHVLGKTWTTDGIYRETRDKVRRRVAEGCLTVEMEAAAFFAVAQFRGVSFGQMLYAGDDLSGEAWDGRGWPHHDTGRDLLLRLAAEAVLRIEARDSRS
ncbi:MAG: nucleoside phosphorylase [Chloroflexi bacterium]|nr:nucleoside phosphorylase [Chloroflexota bacterium]